MNLSSLELTIGNSKQIFYVYFLCNYHNFHINNFCSFLCNYNNLFINSPPQVLNFHSTYSSKSGNLCLHPFFLVHSTLEHSIILPWSVLTSPTSDSHWFEILFIIIQEILFFFGLCPVLWVLTSRSSSF